jgi:uncharacterized membrane protein
MQILRAAAAAAVLLLAGCGPAPPLSSDLTLAGSEPFWAVAIPKGGEAIKVSLIGDPDMDAGYPVESKGEGGEIILTSRSPQGDIVMTLTPGKCRDGLSEREYPWDASVLYKGRTLKGCGGPKRAG